LAPWNILTLPLWKISSIQQKFYINNAVLVVAGDFEKLPKNGLKNTLAKSKGKKIENKISLKNQ
jgi:hypothetical protein